jgi:hypothetical protein
VNRSLNWNEPAKLFFWPSADGGEEAEVYLNLADALQAAGDGDLACAWIVTQNGDILSPRHVRLLRDEELPARRRRLPARSFFGWARAA